MAETLIMLTPEEIDIAIIRMMEGSHDYIVDLCREALPHEDVDIIWQQIADLQIALSVILKTGSWTIKFKYKKGQ